MDRIASSSKDWLLALALISGLLGSVGVAKYVSTTFAIGVVASVVSVALAALLFRCMRSSIYTRAVLLFLFTLFFVLSVRWLSALGTL